MTTTVNPLAPETVGMKPGKIAWLCAAGLGWRVVPGAKDPTKKHPGIKGWPDLATTDPDTLASWWLDEYVGRYVCVVTGRGSGIWNLDIDRQHGGFESLAELEAEHGQLPATMTIATPSGGEHRIFAYPDDLEIGTTVSQVAPGIDTRGWHGQFIAPYNAINGGVYQPKNNLLPVHAPRWLELLAEKRAGQSEAWSGDGEPARGVDQWIDGAAAIPPGGSGGQSQERYLFEFLCKLRGQNVARAEMVRLGWDLAHQFTNEPGHPKGDWTVEDVEQKVEHIMSTYPAGGNGGAEEWMTDWLRITASTSAEVAHPPAVAEVRAIVGPVDAETERLSVELAANDPPADEDNRAEQPAASVTRAGEAEPVVSVTSTGQPADGWDYTEAPPSYKNEDNYGNPGKPMESARAALKDLFVYRGGVRRRAIHSWRGDWYRYVGTHWAARQQLQVQNELYLWLEHAKYWIENPDEKARTKDPFVLREWNPRASTISDLTKALAACAERAWDAEANIWDREGTAPVGRLVACANGLVDVGTGALHPHDPGFFNTYALPFAYDPAADCAEWEGYLASVLDPQSVALLQEWAGYLVSGRNDLGKLLYLYGPTRSGKGTYASIVSALMSVENVAGAQMSEFTKTFGMQNWIGKPLAIFDDVRLPRQKDQLVTAVERLLSVTGRGQLTVDRKNREPWSGVLDTRVMIMSNDLVAFQDSSTALPNRFLVVEYTKSFLGREDVELQGRLLAELPGIFNWALAGLDRLQVNGGRFTEPDTGADTRRELRHEANPVIQFVEERCDRQGVVLADELYWLYAEDHGGFKDGRAGSTKFGQRLKAAYPDVKKLQWKMPMSDGSRKTGYYYDGLSLLPEYRRDDQYLPVTIAKKRAAFEMWRATG